jgi:hypothetical protein
MGHDERRRFTKCDSRNHQARVAGGLESSSIGSRAGDDPGLLPAIPSHPIQTVSVLIPMKNAA